MKHIETLWTFVSVPLSLLLLVTLYVSAVAGIIYTLMLFFTLNVIIAIVCLAVMLIVYHLKVVMG